MHYQTVTPELPRTLLNNPDNLPRLYALICDGNQMEPDYSDGQLLLFSVTEPWRAGDTVAIYRKPEAVPPGEDPVLLRVLSSAPDADYFQSEGRHNREIRRASHKAQLIVRTLNPRRSSVIDAADVLSIHKCLGPIEHHV